MEWMVGILGEADDIRGLFVISKLWKGGAETGIGVQY